MDPRGLRTYNPFLSKSQSKAFEATELMYLPTKSFNFYQWQNIGLSKLLLEGSSSSYVMIPPFTRMDALQRLLG